MTYLTTFRNTDNLNKSLRNWDGSSAYSISNNYSMHQQRSNIPSTVVCHFCNDARCVTLSNHICNSREKGYRNNGGTMSYNQPRAMEFNNMSMHQHSSFHSQPSQLSSQTTNRQTFHQNHTGGPLMPSKSHIYREEEKNYTERYKNNSQVLKDKTFTSENNANMLISNGPCPSSMCNNTETQISYSSNSNSNHSNIPMSFHGNRNAIHSAITGKLY